HRRRELPGSTDWRRTYSGTADADEGTGRPDETGTGTNERSRRRNSDPLLSSGAAGGGDLQGDGPDRGPGLSSQIASEGSFSRPGARPRGRQTARLNLRFQTMMMTGSSPLKMDAKISKSVYMVVVLWKKDLRHRRDLALNRGCLHLRKTLC